MKQFKLIMLMLFAFGAVTAQAAPMQAVNVGLNDVIEAVETPFKPDRTGITPLTDVTAYFFQRSTIAEKKREFRADGQMYFRPATSRSPLMFRFEYFRPTRHQIVSDGKTLWTYLPENRQVIQSDISFFFNQMNYDPVQNRPVNFLQGMARISKDFQITFSPQGRDVAGNFVLELMPRRSMETIRQMFIVVNRDAVLRNSYQKQGTNYSLNLASQASLLFPILSTTVYDHQGNVTTMEFTNVFTNTRLSDSLFNFMIPGGVQVVKPSTGR